MRPGRFGVGARRCAGRRALRWFTGALGIILLAAAIPVLAADATRGPSAGSTPRLATVDWGLAQDLIAMGVTPLAVGQTSGYETWVGQPKLPPATHNLGLRSQPNLELLSQLDPDRILITGMYAALKPKLAAVAPVTTVDVYFTPGPVWDKTVAAAKKLGRITHRPQAAQALIQRTEEAVRHAAQRLPDDVAPLLVIQFSDAQHVYVFGRGSLIGATLQRMGLTNAWQGETSRWGSAQIPLSRLASVQTGRVVVMGPIPVGLRQRLAHNRLWQSLATVRNAPVIYIPGVWSFGGLPSASRFARLVTAALRSAPASGPGWPEQTERSS
ncbi:iron-siderophore ABC transporter substrate-binding protein [Salinisphaera hydrothermalis]|uniref:iron-siderophore ABC transporter substrate-binding protein n=1 Tax=Salinisphaera hydrothermalis TaxID=563188 RepID=UPI00333E47D6